MMQAFMAELFLPVPPPAAFINTIPQQRAHIAELLERGTVSNYALAHDRSRLWVTLYARTEREVKNILEQFPILPFIEYRVHPLVFHDSAHVVMPAISLN